MNSLFKNKDNLIKDKIRILISYRFKAKKQTNYNKYILINLHIILQLNYEEVRPNYIYK